MPALRVVLTERARRRECKASSNPSPLVAEIAESIFIAEASKPASQPAFLVTTVESATTATDIRIPGERR